MAKVRPNRAWGAELVSLRKRAALSGGQVIQELEILGIKLDRRTLYSYEGGRVVAPDPAVIWGLAHIYGASVDALLHGLVASRSGKTPDTIHTTSSTKNPRGTELALIKMLRSMSPRTRHECEQYIRFRYEQD